MIKSIRRFLLINLLLTITLMTTLTVVGTYYFDQEDIQYQLDRLLSDTAFSYSALVKANLKTAPIATIQKNLPPHTRHYVFQVWSSTGKPLLYTMGDPKFPILEQKAGFYDQYIDHEPWRIFSLWDAKTQLYFIVAEPYDERNRLAHVITLDHVTLMLLTYPLSGLLIWFIIGRGLGSIQKVTREVSHREASYLEPVDVSTVPVEIKPLAEALNKLLKNLHYALDREKRFAADAAHELRTPLAGIKTQAQVALKTTDANERQTVLNNVIYGIDRCTHIVNQLLTLSRLTAEMVSLEETVHIRLAKLVGEVVTPLIPIAQEKKITLDLDIHDDSLSIDGNLTAISIMMRNLIDNAIRYTPEGGKIVVSIMRSDPYLLFRVTDNGPGVPFELRKRVFERFYRVLGTKTPGSGLGLSIVQQIARLHNATVTLETPPSGRGLQVTVSFPSLKR